MEPLTLEWPTTRAEAIADCLRVAEMFPDMAEELRAKAKRVKKATNWYRAYIGLEQEGE